MKSFRLEVSAWPLRLIRGSVAIAFTSAPETHVWHLTSLVEHGVDALVMQAHDAANKMRKIWCILR